MLICQKCLTKYTDKYMKVGKNSCPIMGCGGNIIDIPENLVESVIEFTKKGFTTRFCSNTHMDASESFEMYVVFDRIEKDKAKDSAFNQWKLPEGLVMKFGVMRMGSNKEEDSNYLSPRITTDVIDLSGLSNDERIKRKFELSADFSKKLYEFALSL